MSNIAETLNANGWKEFQIKGNFLRLMNTAGAVEIVYYANGAEMARTGVVQAGYAETFRNGGFTALRVYDKSGAANPIEFVHRIGADVRYDRAAGNVLVSNTAIGQKISTYEAGFDYGAAYKSATALAANTPEAIFLPVANVNGALIWTFDSTFYAGIASGPNSSLIAKASAPANTVDGDVIASANVSSYGPSYGCANINLRRPVKIAAGKGLYYIANCAEGAPSALRSCLYTLL